MATDVRKLERPSLRGQAGSRIRAGIITGEIESGRLYTIGEFADQFGVSATPVREALGDLAVDGLIEMVPNRGFMVPPVTEEDLDEIFELRLMLEVPAVARVSGHIGPLALKRCRQLIEQGNARAAGGDVAAFLDVDRAFHLELLQQVGNSRLVQVVERLRDQARLYGIVALAADRRLGAAAAEHEALLTAVEAGDAEGARVLMARHLEHTRGTWAGREEAVNTP